MPAKGRLPRVVELRPAGREGRDAESADAELAAEAGGRPGVEPAGGDRLASPLSRAFEQVPAAWRAVTEAYAASDTGRALIAFVDARLASGATVYPRTPFRALELTAPADVRVVILGQDPYHGPGQAQGLAFSVAAGQRPPPSLRNILAEVHRDLGRPSICRDDLAAWAEQGVLLLNSALTVEQGQPASHAGRGWEALTDALLAHLADGIRPIVFMLWGAAAQQKRAIVARDRHTVLVSNHPSPLSANRPPVPFVGSRPFGRANAHLAKHRPGVPPIRW